MENELEEELEELEGLSPVWEELEENCENDPRQLEEEP